MGYAWFNETSNSFQDMRMRELGRESKVSKKEYGNCANRIHKKVHRKRRMVQWIEGSENSNRAEAIENGFKKGRFRKWSFEDGDPVDQQTGAGFRVAEVRNEE